MIRLTPEQREAVEHDGNLLLTACPGSGKTRVILAKLLTLADHGKLDQQLADQVDRMISDQRFRRAGFGLQQPPEPDLQSHIIFEYHDDLLG